MIITGTALELRPIADADTDNIVRWRNSDAVRRNFIDQRPITAEGHRGWLASRVATGDVVQFIVTVRQTGTDIGSVFLRDIDRTNRHCEFGIFLGEDAARGKGYGTEACRLICGYAFRELQMERVFLRALASNPGALRAYEKAGFTREGVFRRHVFVNGGLCDVVFMGLLKEEWEKNADQ